MRLPLFPDDTSSRELRVRRMADDAAASLRLVVRSLIERQSSTTDSDSYTPASVQKTQNVAIALGVILPVGGAMIVLYFLHRKHLRKQRAEDLNDPHKSLDFGMDGLPAGAEAARKSKKGKKGPPEMIVTDLGTATGRPSRRGHGMSFDMGMESPYLLPAGLQSSRESLHSMSRTYDEHDPYRPVTMMRPSMDTDRFRHGDTGSVYSLTTANQSLTAHDRAGLTANARPMSITPSQRNSPISSQAPTPGNLSPRDSHSPISRARSPLGKPLSLDENAGFQMELQPLPSPPAVPEPAVLAVPPPRQSSNLPVPPRTDSIPQNARPESSIYGDDNVRASIMPDVVVDEPYEVDPASIYAAYSLDEPSEQHDGNLSLHAPQPQRLSVIAAGSRLSIADAERLSVAGGNRLSIMGAGNRLSVMGARPLPTDMPEDNPEVRANRIRSFYKEYFDDSKPIPANAYYEDEYNNDLLDGVYYDYESGGYFAPGGPSHGAHSMPYAQAPGRRAMTPPPRQKPRVSAGPNSPGGLPYPGQHFRKFSSHSTMSGGRPTNFGARGRPMVPAKKLPPPLPLLSLPTPHKLGQDVWISNPIDFAPPSSVRTVQNGARPDSPFGVERPYSPSVRAFTPLASSFDVLAVLPSPHDLRRSGTFTALDFAPPSRIRDPASPGGSRPGSAAGSMRSMRSGISAMQQQAVQKGAYRVSRIPKEMVSSREDLGAMLRPKMDMVSRA